MNGQDLTDLESAAGEALANLCEHSDSSHFEVSCGIDGYWITIEIRGDGCGFLPPAEAKRPPVGSLRGYGLFMMHKFVDSIEFFDGGRGIRLRKRVAAHAE